MRFLQEQQPSVRIVTANSPADDCPYQMLRARFSALSTWLHNIQASSGMGRAASSQPAQIFSFNPLKMTPRRQMTVLLYLMTAAVLYTTLSQPLFLRSHSIRVVINGPAMITQSDGINATDLGQQNTVHASWNPARAHAVLEQLKQLAGHSTAARSSSSKRYRSLICTNVRNDLHLREFLVRNLLLGFSHVVVLDNNQLGSDHNITLLLQPFVQVRAPAVPATAARGRRSSVLLSGSNISKSGPCVKHLSWPSMLLHHAAMLLNRVQRAAPLAMHTAAQGRTLVPKLYMCRVAGSGCGCRQLHLVMCLFVVQHRGRCSSGKTASTQITVAAFLPLAGRPSHA